MMGHIKDFHVRRAIQDEQGDRSRKLFAAVVLAALDDAIVDEEKYGNGIQAIGRWARSLDGRTVLTCAGINPSERAVKGLMAYEARGIKTSVALSQEAQTQQRHTPRSVTWTQRPRVT